MMTESRRSAPVTVLESADPAVLLVAKSLLEQADVSYFAKGEGAQDLFGAGRLGTGFNPGVGAIQLQVAADDADAARELLRDLSS
jgi:hypothetical protein